MIYFPIRHQTGEISEIVAALREGKIPPIDIDSKQEYAYVLAQLAQNGFNPAVAALDKNAYNTVEVPDFDFRQSFHDENGNIVHIDFFSPTIHDRDYDSTGGD
jgi:hypothetical protein